MNAKVEGLPRGQAYAELAQRIGATARAARLQAKFTQADVAERVGLQPEVYGRLERGVMMPSVPTLRKIAVVLKLPSDVIIGLAEERIKVDRTPAEGESSVELRRLLRNLRTMTPEQLKLFRTLAHAFHKTGKQGARKRGREESAQVVN